MSTPPESAKPDERTLCPYCKSPLERGYCGTCNATWWTYVTPEPSPQPSPDAPEPDAWLVQYLVEGVWWSGYARLTEPKRADKKRRAIPLYRRAPDAGAPAREQIALHIFTQCEFGDDAHVDEMGLAWDRADEEIRDDYLRAADRVQALYRRQSAP